MSDTTPETPTAGQDGLRKWATGECNKLLHGECRTLSCLMRGGYVRGTPCDSSVATCEPLEFLTERDTLAAQLATVRAECERLRYVLMTIRDNNVLTELRDMAAAALAKHQPDNS